MKTKITLIVLLICLVLIACVIYIIFPKDNVTKNTNEEVSTVNVLDYNDFDQTASDLILSLLDSGRLKKADGSRYIIETGRIINDTTLRIDTNQLMAKIQKEITDSGQAVFTGSIKAGIENRTFIATKITIAGKLIQRNFTLSNNKQQIEYIFHLELSDIKTGLTFWQNELLVGRTGIN